MRETIERVIAELDAERKEINKKSITMLSRLDESSITYGTLLRGQFQGIGTTISKLEEVLATESNTTDRQHAAKPE